MIALWMAYAVLVAALLGLAAWGGERTFRARNRPTRLLWLGAMGGSLVLPFLVWLLPQATPLPGSALLPSPTPVAEAADVAPDGAPTVESGPLATVVAWRGAVHGWARSLAGASAHRLGVLDGPLLAVWAGSSLLGAALLFAVTLRLRRRVRRCPPVRVGLGTVLVSRDTGPAVLGLWRPRVVVPSWVLNLHARARDVILLHEQEHVNGRDTLILNGALALLLVAAWNPVLWWQLFRLREAVEVDCDRRVLRRGVPARRYGTVLLEVEERMGRAGLAALALGDPTISLERRLEMLKRPDGRRRRWTLAVATLAALAAVAVACEAPVPFVASDSDAPDAEEPATDPDPPGTDRIPVDPSAPDLPPAPDELETRDEADPLPPVPEELAELAEEPTVTPYTVAPEVRNRAQVARALEEAYPPDLRQAGIGGTVLVHFFLDEEGAVRNHLIHESSGQPALDRAAGEVAATFDFSPAYNQGEPVPVWIQIPITFRRP